MKMIKRIGAWALSLLLLSVPAAAAAETAADSLYRVDLASEGVALSQDLYGIFLEDINYSVDGGLYAEMVQNRSFEFFPMSTNNYSYRAHTYAWLVVGGVTMAVQDTGGMNEKNTHYLRVTAHEPGEGMCNSGYNGMVLKAGEEYRLSFYTRGDYAGGYTARLKEKDTVLGEVSVKAEPAGEWTKLSARLTASADSDSAKLELTLDQPGTVDLDMISLFPVHTYNNRENGLRADLVQILKDLDPGFLRFPGGCIVEGEGLENAYNWKDSVGDVSERATIFNRWRRSGLSGYYYQSYGLGFYEYFLLCEDLGCAAIPCLNSGISCWGPQYVQMKDLQPYIDDALDLIEFATGDPANSEWAALRAEMGHPEPFELEYLEIGNEQGGDMRYYERFEEFEKQIHARYPDIKLISSVIGLSNGAGLPTTEWLRGKGQDFVWANDEHFYMSADWFLTNANRYDAMERSDDAFIFAGEYACHYSGSNPHYNAVCEAAFMTGFERNGDVVKLSCYAPLLSKQRYTQWSPNLIIFDNETVFGTPSYWVDYLYGTNLGDRTLTDSVVSEGMDSGLASGKVGVGSWNTIAEYDDLKVVDNLTGEVLWESGFDSDDLSAWSDGAGRWKVLGGVIRQQDRASVDNALHAGDTAWTNYTYTLRARKLTGSEGFIIPFLVKDRLNYFHLNLGGWNNTYSAVEWAVNGGKSTVGTSSFVVQPNRWYDIRIVVDGSTMKCYVDDEMIISSALPQAQPVYTTSSVDEETGDIILKVVNATAGARSVQVCLDNAGETFINPVADMTVLAHDRKDAMNTLRSPATVAPVASKLTGVSESFLLDTPAYSLTVLRIHTRPDSEVIDGQASVALETAVGVPVQLPGTVTVTYADGSCGEKAVTWDHVEETLFRHAGVYRIGGSIDGRPDAACAVVTVLEPAVE